MQGDVAIHEYGVQNEEACAMKVIKNHPHASGATWYLNNSCWAEFGQYQMYSSSVRTCSLIGNSSTKCIRKVKLKRSL